MRTNTEREAMASAAAGVDHHAAEWARWWDAHEDTQAQRQLNAEERAVMGIPTGPAPRGAGVHHETRSGPGTASVTGYPSALSLEFFLKNSVRVTADDAPEGLAKQMDEPLRDYSQVTARTREMTVYHVPGPDPGCPICTSAAKNLMVERLAEVPLAEVAGVITRLFDRIEVLVAEVKSMRGCNR